MPNAVAAVHQPLKASRFLRLRCRRASSTHTLEARRRTVLTQRIRGLGMRTQSTAPLRRIRKAATSARKTTALETSSRYKPKSDARRVTPGGLAAVSTSPSSQPEGGKGGWSLRIRAAARARLCLKRAATRLWHGSRERYGRSKSLRPACAAPAPASSFPGKRAAFRVGD